MLFMMVFVFVSVLILKGLVFIVIMCMLFVCVHVMLCGVLLIMMVCLCGHVGSDAREWVIVGSLLWFLVSELKLFWLLLK